jgi:hypothetical protein
MIMHLPALALSLVAGVEAPPLMTAETRPVAVTVDLAFKPYKDWNILLPDEQFATVGAGISFPHAGGNHFAVKLEGTVLWVDRNGDGKCEAKVEPMERGETGLMVFRAKDEQGSDQSYAVRLSSDGTWSYSASGAMVGELAGQRLQLIDQNNNGTFNDFGEDAMIIGRGKAASFLSKVVNVDGELYSMEISADGSQVQAVPYDGITGAIDLSSQLETKARMRSVVLRGVNNKLSFEVSQAKGAVKVPVGQYTVHSGQIALGKGHADLRTGRMRPLTVTADETITAPWGGPVQAEFSYTRSGAQVQIAPGDVMYYGRLGEEYSNFMPLGSSPSFIIKDWTSGKELVNAKFPGNC